MFDVEARAVVEGQETVTEVAGWARCELGTAVSGGEPSPGTAGAAAGSVAVAAVAEPGSVVVVVAAEFVAGCGTAGAPEEQSRR